MNSKTYKKDLELFNSLDPEFKDMMIGRTKYYYYIKGFYGIDDNVKI